MIGWTSGGAPSQGRVHQLQDLSFDNSIWYETSTPREITEFTTQEKGPLSMPTHLVLAPLFQPMLDMTDFFGICTG